MKFLAVIAQFMVFLAVIFIVGQAAIIPVQNAMSDQANHDIVGNSGEGDIILDGEEWFGDTRRLIFNLLPYLIMLGVPVLALLYYIRLTRVSGRGPGGGF